MERSFIEQILAYMIETDKYSLEREIEFIVIKEWHITLFVAVEVYIMLKKYCCQL